ncbi:MAG: hypothetical protein QXL51_07610, partial [Candidatus Aenigmatarchaeota archaeon]
VIIVAVIIFYVFFLLNIESTLRPQQDILQYSLSNVYGGNETIDLISNINLQSNATYNGSIKLIFANKTIKLINTPYNIIYKKELTDKNYYYIFSTNSFPVLTTSEIEASGTLPYLKQNNTYFVPITNSFQPIIIYSTSEYNQLPNYLLTTSTIPSNSGQVVPASQYYKAGSKVLITAENTSSYGFTKWYGVGNENYTGTDMSAVVVMNSNVSEFAYFEPKYPVNFKSNIPATPFTLNGNSYTTNLKINLTSTDSYTYDFSPAFYSPNKNAYYTLTSIDFCGKTTSSNPNTFIMSEEMNNCTIEATYSIYYLVTFTVYNGSISLSPLGICTGSATSTESCYYPAGTTVTMTDIANSGYAFYNYTGTGNGNYSGTNNPATIVVNGHINEYINNNIVYLVTFTVYNGSITLSPLGISCSGTESSTESCYYPKGTSVTITNTPNSGYTFKDYVGTGSGSYSGTNNPALITVNSQEIVENIYNWFPPIIFTVSNQQPIPTGTYQQEIFLNLKNYPGLSYNSNYANFYFTYSNNTYIPGWIESNNSDILTIWIKLNNLGGDSSEQLQIHYTNTNELSNSGTTGIGEAPQLSPIYAEYDNGKYVFNNYWNFAGTTLGSNWNVLTNNEPSVLVYTSINSKTPYIVDAYLTYSYATLGIATGTNTFEYDYYVLYPSINAYGQPYILGNGGYCDGVGLYYNNGTCIRLALIYDGLPWRSLGSSLYYSVGYNTGQALVNIPNYEFNNYTIVPQTYLAWNSSTNYIFISATGNLYCGGADAVVNNGLYLQLGAGISECYVSNAVHWIRTRTYPPNGVMPTVTFS